MAFPLLQEINKLSVSERADLLWALQNDAEMHFLKMQLQRSS